MLSQSKEIIERHLKTHTERSAEDDSAISTIEFFFRSDGKINTNFAKNVSKNMNNSQNFSFIATWSCFATFTTAGQKEAVESQYGRFLV